jgi:hypothetical protein
MTKPRNPKTPNVLKKSQSIVGTESGDKLPGKKQD